MNDAPDVFDCITPAITPQSFEAYVKRRETALQSADGNDLSFVIRRLKTMGCLGIASLERIRSDAPELGVWLKQAAHGKGYGSEAIRAAAGWAFEALGKRSFVYSVATENAPSRRIAESLGGKIVGTRSSAKYDSVIYLIHWTEAERRDG